MFEAIKKLLGIAVVDYAQLVKGGAIILDVRSKGEFAGGHIKGAVNIAVDQLSNNLHRLPDKTKPVITCCASGMRSGVAKRMLLSNGYTVVYNGGGWMSLRDKL